MNGTPSGGGAPPTRTAAAGALGLAPGQLLAGRYRVLSLVGVGGMGMVYRARDEQLDCDVALKVLRPEFAPQAESRERFRGELRLARQVSHRNVVRIHDLGQDGDLQFLTMDFVAGRSLREMLEEERRLPVERALAVARQLAAALAAAHAEGVVHRDLKPANVLLDADGRALITDFGVARSVVAAGLTQAGAVVGTPDYLSPEQARGEEVDGRSDLYALGILFFEMLSGELPFAGGSYSELLAQRISGAPRDLRDTGIAAPSWLRAVVRRLLERDPRRRYPSADALLADLEAGRSPRPALRRRLLVAGAVAAGAALLALGVWSLGRWTPRAGSVAGLAPAAQTAARAPRHAVVVLPLADETGRSDFAWAPTGVADMLAATLAESPALRVVDNLRLLRTLSDLRLPRGPLPAEELRRLARLLEADRVVSGSVRAVEGQVRVDLRLTAADLPGLPSRALAAEGEAAADLFRLVTELGAALRRELEVEAPAAPAVPPTRSPAAMQAYSEGVERLSRGDAVGAAPALERATAADPEFAAAWVRLAAAYQALGHDEPARAAAERAAATVGGGASRIAHEARAQEALLRGDPENAAGLLAELVERYPNDAEARLALGEARGQLGDLEGALAALGEAVRLDPTHPRGWFLLAKHAILAGDQRRAVDDYLVRAMVLHNQLGSDQGKADVLNARGVALQGLGEFAAAAASYREAAALRERIGDRRGYATSLKNLANLALQSGDDAGAERDLETARGILEEIGDRAGTAEIDNAFGWLEENRGRPAAALDHYRRALQARRELGDRLGLAQSLHNVGYAYLLLGEYDNARVYWQQALGLQRAAGDRAGVVASTQSIGQLELAQGQWEAALRSFHGSLEESRALGMKDAEAAALGFLGRVAHLQGRYQAALDSYDEALARLRQLDDRRGLAEFSLHAAEALAELGMLAATGERLEEAAAWLADGANDEQLAEFHCLRGEWRRRRGEASARDDFAEARRRAESSRSAAVLLRTRLARAAGEGAAGAADLRAVLVDAERLGHAPLRLRVAEALAAAELAAGRQGEAAAALRGALRLAQECGAYAGAYRLHLGLARALAADGQHAAAQAERRRAAGEIERLRQLLAPEQRSSFDRLAEVHELERDAAPPGS